MGSRQIRLHNEALRRQQAAIDGRERIAERKTMALSVKNLLSEYKQDFENLSYEQANKFKEYREERLMEESNRKQRSFEEIKARKFELNEQAKETRALLKEFHIAHIEISNALRHELTAYADAIRQDVDGLLHSFSIERQQKKREYLKDLSSFISNLKFQDLERRKQNEEDRHTRREYIDELLGLKDELPCKQIKTCNFENKKF